MDYYYVCYVCPFPCHPHQNLNLNPVICAGIEILSINISYVFKVTLSLRDDLNGRLEMFLEGALCLVICKILNFTNNHNYS